MSRRTLLPLVLLPPCAVSVCFPTGAGARGGAPMAAVVRTAHAVIMREQGVAPGRAATVAAEIDRLQASIGHDLGTTPPGLRVYLYASHVAFARALLASQRSRPQSSTDDASAIVRGTLLLGPLPPSYLRHNLAHVYTEWIIDRLTGNRTDALPSTPWLYDGLAEYEAYRYEPAGMRCAVKGRATLDITRVRTARQWMALRAGPLGALEYCLAYVQTRDLVRRIGWSRVRQTLQHGWTWPVVARRLLRRSRQASAAGRGRGRTATS